MVRYEYKVVPAPKRGEKARGVKGIEDRFALALTTLMNQFGRDGWEYVRCDNLPVEERHGLAGRITTSAQNMLVFRRVIDEASARPQGELSRPAETVSTPGFAEPPQEPTFPMESEPLSATAASKLASILPLPEARRSSGPKLVASPQGKGHAPALGPAKKDLPSAD